VAGDLPSRDALYFRGWNDARATRANGRKMRHVLITTIPDDEYERKGRRRVFNVRLIPSSPFGFLSTPSPTTPRDCRQPFISGEEDIKSGRKRDGAQFFRKADTIWK
jgi:hypothetical protein